MIYSKSHSASALIVFDLTFLSVYFPEVGLSSFLGAPPFSTKVLGV